MQIPYNKMHSAQRVYYRYAELEAVSGPFRVIGFYSNFEGRHVRLLSPNNIEERDVLLAADDDFGEPIFYDNANGD